MAKYLDYEGLGRYTSIIQDELDGLQTAIDGKAPSTHGHAASDITSGTFPTERIADGAVTAAKLGSDVGIVAVSATEPTDENVLFWIEIS